MYRVINRITLGAAFIVAAAVIGSFFVGSTASKPKQADASAFCPITFQSSGSTTVYPIERDSEASFETLWGPGTDVQIGAIGSGNGIAKLTAGEVEAAPSSRPFTGAEAANKYVYKIALDEFVIEVSSDPSMNWLTNITRAQLANIYSQGAAINTFRWSDVTPAIPGATTDFVIPRARITGSGSQPDFITKVGNGLSVTSEANTIDATGLARLTESVDMAAAAAAAPNTIVYTSLANVTFPGTRALTVDGVAPSQASVLDGSYGAMIRTLFIAVNDNATNPRIENSNFVRADDYVNFLRSSTVVSLISAEGFVPVPAGAAPPVPDWDINMDGNTTLSDLGAISSKWGATSGCKGWIRADANNNGSVSLTDIGIVTNHYGGTGFKCALAPANPCPE